MRKIETHKQTLMPTTKEKITWLEEGKVINQQNGTKPHRGRDTEETLNDAEREGSWRSARYSHI